MAPGQSTSTVHPSTSVPAAEPPVSGAEPSRESRRRRTADLLARLPGASPQHREEILEQVILLNRCVAESIAHRFGGRGVAFEDLRQVADEALVKSVRRYDPASGKDLLALAVPTIRGEIKRHFRDLGWMVRPPRRVQELQQRIGRATDSLQQSLGREPEPEEVADWLGVSTQEYEDAQGAYGCFSATSLDRPVTESGRSLGELVPEDEDPLEAAEARVALEPAVRRLTTRERRILHLRFVEDRTQAEIGAEIGVTQMQVSRLLTSILGSMRQTLTDAGTRGVTPPVTRPVAIPRQRRA